MKQSYLKILKSLLPILFISYLAGITLFTHSHVVNGVTIVHSHPFKKDTEHKHTTNELQLIYLLSHVVTSGSIILPLLLVVCSRFMRTLMNKPETSGYASLYRGVLSLRAPPFYC